MRIIRSILKYLTYGILSILLVFSLYTFIMTKVFNYDYVNIFGYTYFVVASGSMSGTIEVNDIVIVKIDSDYKENDIITFYDEGAFITHRVVSIDKEKVITRGDVNTIEDEPVKRKDIIGKVSYILSFSLLLKIFMIIAFIIVIVIILNFEKIFKKYILKEKPKKNDENTPLEYTQVLKIIDEDKPRNKDDELSSTKEDEFIDLVLKLFKKKDKDLKVTKAGSLKLQYIYELASTILYDVDETNNCLKRAPFDEIYDYDFDDINFTKTVQDKLYEMPIYIYLKLLVYCLLYDENEYFDAIFKVLRYRIKVDKDNDFLNNSRNIDEVLIMIKKIVAKMGKEDRFELHDIRNKIMVDKEIKKNK